MSAAPAVIPFLCSAFLAVFIIVRRVRENVARLALVSWLLGCNMVQGINASIWSSNVDLKALEWCDLMTKLVLATTVAVPGACLCIARHLELVSSSRNLPASAKARKNQRLFDAIICYLIPFLYMTLHIIGQDHRFDLVKGIGYIESRSSMTSRIWSCMLAISMSLTTATLLVVLFSMFGLPMSDSWISWQHVHQYLSQVDIVTQKDQISGILTYWWGLRVITICYIVFVLFLGEESRDILRFLRAGAKKTPVKIPPFIASRPRRQDKNFAQQSSFPPSFDNSFDKPRRPVTLELKSGWDDDLDFKSSGGLSRLSPMGWKKGRASPPTSPSPSPSTRTVDDFVTNSMPYLSQTMTNPMGFSTPVVPPPPVYQSSWKKSAKAYAPKYDLDYEAGLSPNDAPSSSTKPLDIKKKHRPAESRGSNIITAMLQEQWPSPPSAIPSPIPCDMTPILDEAEDEISPTRASSPASRSTRDASPDALVTSPSPSPAPSPAPRTVKRSLTRRPSLSSIRSFLGKDKPGHGASASNDVIHMTVVQETV
ncbi:hypothetical protein NP233_g6478 [Leucocoprinus birnbaumii]|uniref:Pheromone receptor n=1 Tax=Leucocoprinus birnbaumii TaxID=56174 RepID=A0AAD5YPZ6_9AGAR|nr:hypothetical protein NP233_g6478 [Leucocoprinus birnbaumii]